MIIRASVDLRSCVDKSGRESGLRGVAYAEACVAQQVERQGFEKRCSANESQIWREDGSREELVPSPPPPSAPPPEISKRLSPSRRRSSPATMVESSSRIEGVPRPGVGDGREVTTSFHAGQFIFVIVIGYVSVM